ncbi:MAG: hypothetical protein LPK58_03975 [Gammaproteobacteria bacterium]|jgi:hypothetical protein|nr:hypothetical protein [Chromatiales bacterium]MDX5333185.1 hypothetical protein [Gammaproteobacteria bacterium]MDX5374840.1 hypothetical protein [Gammaproteobacteria bacterium]
MNIDKLEGKTVTIRARESKARDLLDGLLAHQEELGELGQELARLLQAAGIEPNAQPEHVRTEYMPPLAH